MRNVIERVHEGTHWGTQALIDFVKCKYVCRGMYTIAMQILWKCIHCVRINKKVMHKQPMGGRDLAV